MKLFHLSDLHLGKRVNEFSMLDDQRYILNEIITAVDNERPDAVIIAGDVYDKSVPPVEAVELFDDFLMRLSARSLPVFIISGNHDSPERLAFASEFIKKSGVYISPVYDGNSEKYTLEDEHGTVNFWMLPFVKPVNVRRFYPDADITSYTDAVGVAVQAMKIDEDERNILLTHQFVTGASRTESEDISVGGTDNVDASVFGGFDYVALGHIHRSQKVGDDRVRYCGTPLKYSFSEVNDNKSITVVELGAKGDVQVSFVDLLPKRDLVEIKGEYNDLMSKSFYSTLDREAYYRIILTDEEDIPDAIAKLRVVYKNIMRLEFDNTRTRTNGVISSNDYAEETDPLKLFGELFEKQNGRGMSSEQEAAMKSLIEKLWEVDE